MTKAIQFKHFDKFNFVESFIATVSDPKVKEEEKKRAVIIAEAIEESQGLLLENLATKKDLEELRLATKKDLEELRLATKHDLQLMKYQLTGVMATLIVFLPPFVEVIKKMFGF